MKSMRRSQDTAQTKVDASSVGELSQAPPARARLHAAELWVAVHLPALPAGEQRPGIIDSLAARALQFTPRVSLAPPDGLLFEVRSSLHLFGGLQTLCHAYQLQCAELLARNEAVSACLSVAPTPLAALALARAGVALQVIDVAQLASSVSELPLRTLRWPEEALARLVSMGVRTIGEAVRLPRAGFARRFGPALLIALDRLLGRRSDPRSVFRLRERFRARRDMHYETAAQDRILHVVQGMLAEMEAFLRQRQCGVNVLELRLAHRNLPDTRCLLRLAMAQHLAQEFGQLLQEHLARLSLPAVVRSCRLRSGRLIEAAPESASLWRPGEHGGGATLQIPAFIERLRARLGADAVYGLCLVPGHRPERVWCAVEPQLKSAAEHSERPEWSPAQRPLWLLQAPRALELLDGWPVHDAAALQLLSGPERLETGWWDGRDICRDYYVARGARGEKLWVFRERSESAGWFVHGMFG